MARYNIYLNQNLEAALVAVFEYLKARGEIPANATDIGPYRAQVIGYTLKQVVEEIQPRDVEV